jgi:bacterioferritin-associated ferredoxin
MVICVCNNVSERRIREAASRGTRTLEELSEHLGVATGCGTCAECARECLKEALAETTPEAAQPQTA